MSDVPVPLLAKEFFTPEFLRDPYPTYRRYLDGPGLQYIDMARKRTDSGMPPRCETEDLCHFSKIPDNKKGRPFL